MAVRELRRAKRTRRRNAAWIGLGNGGTRIPCVLWDISESGARLAAPRCKGLPGAFNLLLTKDGSARRRCRVVWRNDRQLGVEFVAAAAPDDDEDNLPRPATGERTPSGGDVATASLLLPGYGPAFLEKPQRQGIRISIFAGCMLVMLVIATALFAVAGMQSALEAPWALQLCERAENFCQHPEWTGIAGALMAVVFLAVRGMES
jgi:hypothetical protein